MLMILHLLDILTIAFALVAAWLWFKSAKIKMPESFSAKPTQPYEGAIVYNPPKQGEAIVGNNIIGPEFSKELSGLAFALKEQSRNSGCAATFAGLSAVAQMCSVFVKHYIL